MFGDHVIYFFYREVGKNIDFSETKSGYFNIDGTLDPEDWYDEIDTIPESRLIYLKLKYGL